MSANQSFQKHPDTQKRGVSILLTLIVLSALLFIVFGTAKFLEMTELSLRLTYVAMQTVQKGRIQIPNKPIALESMAVVARANGFDEAMATDQLQTLRSGTVKFTYDESVPTEPVVRAYYTSSSGLLANIFKGFSSSNDPGISAETAAGGMGGTLGTGATLVYADMSDSMKGPKIEYDTGDHSRVKELLEAYGFNVMAGPRDSGTPNSPATPNYDESLWNPSGANPASMCWPIDISDCMSSSFAYLSTDPYTKARQCCNAARQNLPGYLGTSWVTARPYDPNHQLVPGYPVSVDYQTDYTNYQPYNPGLPAAQQIHGALPGGEIRMICNTAIAGISLPATSSSPTPSYKGYRWGDFDLRACFADPTNHPACDRFAGVSRFTNDLITDRDFCNSPWHWWSDWQIWREDGSCTASPTQSEIAGLCGVASQLSSMYDLASDFFITYKRLTEAFLIGLNDFNTNLVFSVFAAGCPYGGIVSSSGERFLKGNYVLYNGFESTFDIERQPVDLTKLFTVDVPGTGTPPAKMRNGLNLETGYYRTRLTAHLDRAHFPNLNPGEDTPYPFSSHLWTGSEYLMSIKNPKVNREKGASLPWGLEQPFQSPASADNYFLLHAVDTSFGVNGIDLFPNGPRNMTWFPAGLIPPMAPYFMTAGFQRYKWWPLMSVGTNGIQTTNPLQVPKVQSYAREVFGHGLGPMLGGTDVRSVIDHMNETAEAHETATGGINGRRWFSIIISDGKPNEPSATQMAINTAYNSIASHLQPAPAINYNDIISEIKTGLESFEEKVPSLTILLFVQHSPPDAETIEFTNLFNPTTNGGNYKRALFQINYSNLQDFREKYKQALTFISILLKSTTKFVH